MALHMMQAQLQVAPYTSRALQMLYDYTGRYTVSAQ